MGWSSILDTVGKTPLVQLKGLGVPDHVTLLAKLEFYNPSGSIKDRIVAHILKKALESGALSSGGTIVEPTSGNTGAAVAMMAAILGCQAILTMPDKVSQEKQDTLKAYGAQVLVLPTSASPDSPDHYVARAKQIAEKTPNSFTLNQYNNLENPEAHYLTTAPEIWEQTEGRVDYFVASASTGGTITGVSRYLKEKKPSVHTLLPDPVGSVYYDYFKTGKVPKEGNCNYHVEGVGEDHIVEAIDFSVIDSVMKFTDQNAFQTAQHLARREGVFAGGSGGANIWAALQLAQTLEKPSVIVTVIPDGGFKYLSKFYNPNWMKKYCEV